MHNRGFTPPFFHPSCTLTRTLAPRATRRGTDNFKRFAHDGVRTSYESWLLEPSGAVAVASKRRTTRSQRHLTASRRTAVGGLVVAVTVASPSTLERFPMRSRKFT